MRILKREKEKGKLILIGNFNLISLHLFSLTLTFSHLYLQFSLLLFYKYI